MQTVNFIPNPEDVKEIERRVAEDDSPYLNDMESVHAFYDVPVIVLCYRYVAEHGVVSVGELIDYVMTFYRDADIDAARIRAKKLVRDFYRKLHTAGLLKQYFGSVEYVRGNDPDARVDFKVTLKMEEGLPPELVAKEFGIVSKMRHSSEQFHSDWKQPGDDVFRLTNDTIKQVKAGQVYLFKPAHIIELLRETRKSCGLPEFVKRPKDRETRILELSQYHLAIGLHVQDAAFKRFLPADPKTGQITEAAWNKISDATLAEMEEWLGLMKALKDWGISPLPIDLSIEELRQYCQTRRIPHNAPVFRAGPQPPYDTTDLPVIPIEEAQSGDLLEYKDSDGEMYYAIICARSEISPDEVRVEDHRWMSLRPRIGVVKIYRPRHRGDDQERPT